MWQVQFDAEATRCRHGHAGPDAGIFQSSATQITLRKMAPVIELEDVQDMSVRQIVDFCNEKIDVVMEEAVSATKSAAQAHHAAAQAQHELHSCEAMLMDFTERLHKMEQDLEHAQGENVQRYTLLQLKIAEINRLLQRREDATSSYVNICCTRFAGMNEHATARKYLVLSKFLCPRAHQLWVLPRAASLLL